MAERWDLIDLHEEPVSLATAEILLLRALRRVRTPVVLYSAQNIDKRYPQPFRWLERQALQAAAGLSVCNGEAGEIASRKGLRGPARLIPLGVDVDRYRPTDRQPPGAAPVVGYVGRLEPHKGVATLIEAAALRPSWKVVLAGDGPQRQALVNQVRQLGVADRVEFRGHLDQDALPEFYQSLDVLAVTSLPTPGWLEQFCRVAVEAMASGVPVVASRTGAIPDVLDAAGVLVEPGRPDDLAAGVDQALSSWQSLRAAGLERAAGFTWKSVAESQRQLYQEVLDRQTGRRLPDDDDPEHEGEPTRRPPPQVLVVAYGPAELLDRCLKALGPGLPVTVVDNSSSEATRAVAAAHGARYIDAGSNLGFAGGVNRGLEAIAQSNGDAADVVLLNPDARVNKDTLLAMQHAAYQRRIAAVGATQLDPATGESARVLWPFPSPTGAWIEAIGLGRLRRRPDFAIGSVLLLRADALKELGGLDERFFLYAEETDWQKRARDRGWDILVLEVTADHVGAGTGGDPTVRETYFHASLERFVRKHHGVLGWSGFRAAMIAGSVARAALVPGDRAAAARRRCQLYVVGPVRSEHRLSARADLQIPDCSTGSAGSSETDRPRPRLDGFRVAQVVCGDGFAGVERYLGTLAKGLAGRGAEVLVIGGDPTAMPHYLGSATGDGTGRLRWRRGATRSEVAAVLRAERVDLIHAHMTEAELVSLLVELPRRVPVVATQHFAGRRGSDAAARFVGRWINRRLAAQIAISEYVAEHTGSATDVVPSGVAPIDSRVPSARRERAVLVAQRLEREKDTAVALEAWSRTVAARSGWRLWIAGDGSMAGELRALTNRLGIAGSVEFLGRRSDVPELMARAALLLAPTPIEGLGLTVIEAMASGLPVVAAEAGGHLETVGSVTPDLLFPPGDAAAAAAQIDALLADPGRLDRVGAGLQERQRADFSVDRQVDRIVAIYRRVLGWPGSNR